MLIILYLIKIESMKKLLKLTIFFFLFISKSIPALSQQFLWTTSNNGLLTNSEIKVISKEEVVNKVLSYYEMYNEYYDASGYSKEVFLNQFENSIKFVNKSKWVEFKNSVNNIKELSITGVKSNNGKSSSITIFIFNKNNFDAIIFSNELKEGAISTYNSMNQDDKSRFVKFFESLIGITKTNLPDRKSSIIEEDKNKVFTEVQIPAEFPGGQQGWIRYLERTLNRDLPQKNNAPAGKYSVTLSFIVSKDGSISDINSENDPGYGTKAEAIRIIQNGPNWKPAVQNGRNVNYRHQCTIDFIVK
jgi:hypothetical protein